MLAKPNDTSAQPDSSTMKRILHNALDHFSRYGYAGASVREITHASQVTKPTLYYYFKNKEELFRKLSETCFQEVLNALTAAAATPGTTCDRALNMIREYCRLCQERYCVVRFVHLVAVAAERNAPDVGVIHFGNKINGLMSRIVSDGVDRGEVEASRAEAITYTLMGLFTLRITALLVSPTQEMAPFSTVEAAVAGVLTKH